MRRGVVGFEYSSAENGDLSLNGTSRFPFELVLHVICHMEIDAIAYQRVEYRYRPLNGQCRV
jgi:hypothetical protein